jgi:hypothetical protein
MPLCRINTLAPFHRQVEVLHGFSHGLIRASTCGINQFVLPCYRFAILVENAEADQQMIFALVAGNEATPLHLTTASAWRSNSSDHYAAHCGNVKRRRNAAMALPWTNADTMRAITTGPRHGFAQLEQGDCT